MKNTTSTIDAVNTCSTLTFEEIIEFLEEQVADYQLNNSDDDGKLAPLNFNVETNSK